MHDLTENKELRIERLDATRLKDLEILFEAVHGFRREKDYYRRKYDTNFTGVAYMGYVAYNLEDIPVAYYGVMPCFILYNHETILSAQSGDTMTHPSHRHKGLFVELSKATFELCKTAGIKLIFGFPNQNSYPGMIHKLGWKEIGNLERFTIPVSAFPLEALSGRLGSGAKWMFEKYTKWVLRKYLLPLKGLPNSVLAEGAGGVFRDDRYFRYKTYSNTQVIKAGNAQAWIKIKGGLIIGDIDVTDRNFDGAMNAIKKIAKRMGISGISFQVSPGTHTHALFAARYIPMPSFPALIQDLGAGFPINTLKFTFSDIDIF